jgi:hypothetical protein
MSADKPVPAPIGNTPKLRITTIPILIAIWIPIWQAQFEHGWLEMALGRYSVLFWVLVLIWGVTVGWSIRRYGRWWLLITGLPILYSAAIATSLLSACIIGNCL